MNFVFLRYSEHLNIIIMKVLKFLVIYDRKAGYDEIITPQELGIYALSWDDALSKAKEYEVGFFGLELRQIIKM